MLSRGFSSLFGWLPPNACTSTTSVPTSSPHQYPSKNCAFQRQCSPISSQINYADHSSKTGLPTTAHARVDPRQRRYISKFGQTPNHISAGAYLATYVPQARIRVFRDACGSRIEPLHAILGWRQGGVLDRGVDSSSEPSWALTSFTRY
jgi:hypothetical protein